LQQKDLEHENAVIRFATSIALFEFEQSFTQ
jgi:hypothetical protein